MTLYEELPDSVWVQKQPPPYWAKIYEILSKFVGDKTILDVGCYRGDFLARLPSEWKLLGIEPSRKAALYAAARGIRILGSSVESCELKGETPGVITAFDVVEHVINPLSFLTRLRNCLAPNGCILILTGATDTLPFRIFGRRYWYSALPEHVTFYSLKWFLWAADRLEMRVASHHYLSTEAADIRRWMRQFAMISIYTIVQILKERGVAERWIRLIPYGGLALNWSSVPWWQQSRDHILVVLEKRNS